MPVYLKKKTPPPLRILAVRAIASIRSKHAEHHHLLQYVLLPSLPTDAVAVRCSARAKQKNAGPDLEK